MKSLRWLIVGELHGTAEVPAIFRELVCQAAATGRSVVVALERSESEQPALDVFMRSSGDRNAAKALLKAHAWQAPMQDGRSSIAYLNLINELRKMQQKGQIRRVVAFQPMVRDPAIYEEQMAKRLLTAPASEGALVVALVGNVHAMKRPMGGRKLAAAYLPGDRTFTINVEGDGGFAWNCSPECGVHPAGSFSERRTPGLEMLKDAEAPWDALLNLGIPTSASRPAAAEATTKTQ